MKKIISLEEITKTYPTSDGGYQALRGINLEVHETDFVAIMGPSGSGKSTLMHILGALDVPSSGRYMLNGKDISDYSDDELAEVRNRHIGFVFQSFNLLPRTTVSANVERPLVYAGVPKSERRQRALEALDTVNIRDKADNRSNSISGGQIQRVAIARALVVNPTILLADEPTGNLDSKTSIEIMLHLQKQNDKGVTIILITHEPDIALFAKRVIHLKDGLIQEDSLQKQYRPSSKSTKVVQ